MAREYPIAVYYDAHGVQLLTYLRCSDVELGLVISFDPKPHVRRFIMRNAIKGLIGQNNRDQQIDAEATLK